MTACRTLRRKLQKKLKHKPHRKCPQCGKRAKVMLVDDKAHSFDVPRLFLTCGHFESNSLDNGLLAAGTKGWAGQVMGAGGCGFVRELFWSGGGIGRHIPHGQPGGERPEGVACAPDGCAGSNPALTYPSSQEQ